MLDYRQIQIGCGASLKKNNAKFKKNYIFQKIREIDIVFEFLKFFADLLYK